MSHYFVEDKNLVSRQNILKYTYKKQNLQFRSDSGVFSKNRIDFGTNILLNSLPDFNEKMTILDVGCGIGVIGLAIAKAFPHTFVKMIDVNPTAVTLTEKNIKENKVSNANVVLSDLYQNVNGIVDVVISNPPIRAGKVVVHKIVEEGYNYLSDKGSIYVVIQKKQGALSLKQKILEVFKNVVEISRNKGYFVFQAVKNAEK